MKVRELIAKLEKLQPNADVYICDQDCQPQTPCPEFQVLADGTMYQSMKDVPMGVRSTIVVVAL